MRFRLIGLIGLLAFLVSFVTFAQPGNAQAALTLNNFVGFETNGLDELLASSGSPVTGANSRSGDWGLFVETGETADIATITGGATDSDNDFILGFGLAEVGSLANNHTIVRMLDDSGAEVGRVDYVATGNLRLIDATGTTIATTSSSPITTVNSYHFIEIRWQHSASGAFDLHVNSASEISESGVDLTDGGAIGADLAVYRFEGHTTNITGYDDFYAYSGGTGTGDFLGNVEVFRYQNRENSTTSDSSTCVSLSNNLDQGVWQDVGETPLGVDSGVEPAFQTTGDGGLIFTDDTQSGDNGRHGPHGDANIDGDSNIRGAKWLHRLRRGNGGGGDQTKCFGNDAESVGATVITLTVSFESFITISTLATREPLSTEHFAQGMHTAAARDIEGEEFWSFILHVPDAGATPRRIFPVQ